eukprot:CAMPEP_0168247516 /NCGR_PEP_ID=MMETSP0141_2-20121125/948_1 /TAXON_ID=44445 /ORGANISM="Pseudo-nitzschia australis, Strain 10249 10 AB" /LENGTH=31 /DNA_ID= /DNA_START= /DNA_END= /DNA_ORIENTATION=
MAEMASTDDNDTAVKTMSNGDQLKTQQFPTE